jgi:hypothetical protein
MKLLVIGSLIAVLLPLSTFWTEDAQEKTQTFPIAEGKVVRDTDLSAPTPTPSQEESNLQDSAPEQMVQEKTVAISPAVPAQASKSEHLTNLALSLGVDIPVVNGPCLIAGVETGTINGCYTPYSHYITITTRAMSYGNDEWLSCIILHEYRHYLQDIGGMYEYENGLISNYEELERDAEAYSGCS